MEYIRIVMVRENLENIPQYPLPDGYRVRLFRAGDRKTWVRVQQASEPFVAVTPKTFDDNFGDDLSAMRRRGYFLVSPDGEDVGTITAWYDRKYAGRRWGRIHWVAITPPHRAKHLSKGMMTIAMNRLRGLGHRRVMLGTQTPRIPAIRTYLRFGFVPDMTTKDAERAWKLVRKCISHTALEHL
jgi:GNAT superfamily N-acetyltransferase